MATTRGKLRGRRNRIKRGRCDVDKYEGNGGKVVPLAGFRKNMRFPQISEVRAYWEALRDGRPAPYRSEVDPRGIERALEHAFVLERIVPGVARFRLAGMHLNDLMGMEVRGMPFTTFFAPAARAEIGLILESVFSGPRTAELTIQAEAGLGKPALEGRILLLPLKSDLGDVTRVLGCFVAEGPVGRAPRRFEVRGSLASPVIATAPDTPRAAGPLPGVAMPAPMPPRAAGFAEAPAPFAGPAAAAPVRSRAHLRLVASDE